MNVYGDDVVDTGVRNDDCLSMAVTENLDGELQSRDEVNEQLAAELEGSKEDVDRMVEVLKTKEQEHAGETAELVNKNSELTEMLDDTMEKLDTAQKELEDQASHLAETEVCDRFNQSVNKNVVLPDGMTEKKKKKFICHEQ